jgi:3-hydroxyisobutyrate dehydrogenase-like beta-hydroxyacid dehydrogenase
MNQKIGLIGTGLMGAPMAKNWLNKSFSVTILPNNPPSPPTLKNIEELKNRGAEVVNSLKELVEKSDVIILMLPTSKEVENIALGDNGLIHLLNEKQLCIDMTTSDPKSTERISSEFLKKNLRFFDSPVTGGVKGAEAGTLTLFIGGPEKWFMESEDLLKAVSSVRTHFGKIGKGHVAKIINNFICIGNLTVFSEALPFSTKLGIDPDKMFQTLLSGTASSEMLKIYVPNMIKGDFSPKFKLAHAFKDLKLAASLAKDINAHFPVLDGILEDFENASTQGLLNENLSSVVKPIEEKLGASFRYPK